MTDIVDKKTRSRMMAGIRGKNTKPEILVRKFIFGHGFRYRLHDKKLPGSPDLVLSRYRLAIFVHGCFWHRHQDCKLSYVPKSSTEKWQAKFSENIQRDRKQIGQLIDQGWRVLVIWECGLKPSAPDLSWLPEEIGAGHLPYSEWPSETGTLIHSMALRKITVP